MFRMCLSNSQRLMFSAFCFEFLFKSNDLNPIDSVPRGPLSPLKRSHDCCWVVSQNNDGDDLSERQGEPLNMDTCVRGGGGKGVTRRKAVKITASEREDEREWQSICRQILEVQELTRDRRRGRERSEKQRKIIWREKGREEMSGSCWALWVENRSEEVSVEGWILSRSRGAFSWLR